METNGIHPPVLSSPIAKGSIVTTMSSPIGVGSLDILDNLTIPQSFDAPHVSKAIPAEFKRHEIPGNAEER